MRIQRCPSSFTFAAQQRAGANARVWRASEVRWLLSPLTATLPSSVDYTPSPSFTRANDFWTRIRPIDDLSATLSAPSVETAAAFCGVVDDGAQRPSLSTPYSSYLASERQHIVRWTTRCQVAGLRACRSTLHRCSVLGCRRCPKRCVPISRRAPNGTKTMITDTMMATEVPWKTAMAACAIRNGDA